MRRTGNEEARKSTVESVSVRLTDTIKRGNLNMSEELHPWDRLPGSHPWDDIATGLVQRYPDMPQDWLDYNFSCDDWVRDQVYGFFNNILLNPKCESKDYFLVVRASVYAFWHAFSQSISDAILWNESEAYRLQSSFRKLPPRYYIELCGLMHCGHVAMTERDSPEAARGMIGIVGSCFGITEQNGPRWLRLCGTTLDRSEGPTGLAHAVMVCLNEQCNKIFGMPNLDLRIRSNLQSLNRVKWEGLMVLVNKLHNKMVMRPDIMTWTENALHRRRA